MIKTAFYAFVIISLLLSGCTLSQNDPEAINMKTPAVQADEMIDIAITTPLIAEESISNNPLAVIAILDEGDRNLDGTIPFAMKLDDGSVRLYYSPQGGITSAISKDGLVFIPEDGLRIPPGTGMEMIVADPTVIRTPEGGFRLFYKGAEGGGHGPIGQKHRIFSAYSDDGINFNKEGLVFDIDDIAGVPDAVVISEDPYRAIMYFPYFGTLESPIAGLLYAAISSDGADFVMTPEPLLPQGFVDPAMVTLSEGGWMMVCTFFPEYARQGPAEQGFYGFYTEDGLNFSDPVLIFSPNTEEKVVDASLVHIEHNDYRLYYWVLIDEMAGEFSGIKSIKLTIQKNE